ncbi:hypothetical protein OG292_19795 [Streptomyces sp. NBC_01511]|uniref:hypothetical protein n=1 Tax=Streptomyces sp. NBC_01511 TaxID=2903889 RepID=UPI0038663398
MSTAPSTAEWCREAVRRVGRGSGRLCTLLARRTVSKGRSTGRTWWAGIRGWLGESSGLGWLMRVVVLIVGALILRKLVISIAAGLAHRADSGRWLLWPLAVVWIVAAYRIGRKDWEPKEPQEKPAEPESEEDAAPRTDGPEQPAPAPEETRGPAPEAHRPSYTALSDAVARFGTPHAHITVLAAVLGTTGERVREALALHDIPVEPVRMRGRGSSTGVRGDHFPAPPPDPGPPSDGVVAAGQPANNNTNNTSGEENREGPTIIPDPINDNRWLVQHDQ